MKIAIEVIVFWAMVLSKMHYVAFAACCAERLLPNYNYFCREERWGDPRMLQEALEWVWTGLEDGDFSNIKLASYLEDFDTLLPDTEDFKSSFVSSALDAGTSVHAALLCMKDGDVQHSIDAATVARDTVYLFLGSDEIGEDTVSERIKIESHQLMIREVMQQKMNLEMLESEKHLNPVFVLRLRYSWQNDGMSNINLK
jgi:uncharacterized protein YjaG (DUF416 family)